MSILGLGFSFQSYDRGLSRTVQGIESRIDNLTSSVSNLDRSARANAFGRFIDGLQLNKLNQIADSIGNIADSASSPRLTNSLDSMGVSINKEFGKAFAGIEGGGKAFKQLKRDVSGAVIGMNLDQGAAIKTVKDFASYFGPDFAKRFGFKSTGSFLKTFEVLGVDSGKAASAMSKLEQRSGLVGVEAQTLADEVFTLGKGFGAGTETLTAFYDNVEKVQDSLRGLGITGPAATKKATHSISLLAGALIASGSEAAPAFEKAIGVFDKLTANQKFWMDSFAGVAKGSPELLTTLTTAYGSLDKAIATAKADPAAAVSAIGSAMANLRGKTDTNSLQQLQRLQVLAEEMGIPLEITGGKIDAFMKQQGSIEKALANSSGAMKKAADVAYSSGRTIDEVLDLMRQGFEVKLRRTVKEDLYGKDGFVNRTKKAYKVVGDTITDFAADDGPIGELTRRMIMFSTVGVSGLIGGGLGTAVDGLLEMSAAAIPGITALGAMGLRFHHLLAPVKAVMSPLIAVNALLGGLPGKALAMAKIPMMIGAGLIGLGALSDGKGGIFGGVISYVENKLPVDILSALVGFNKGKFQKKYGTTMEKMLASGEAWDIVKEKFSQKLSETIAWASDNFWKGVETAKALGMGLLKLVDKGFDYLLTVDFTAGTKKLIDAIAGGAERADGSALGNSFINVLKKGWDAAVHVLGGIATGVWDRLAGWWTSQGDSELDRVKNIWSKHGETIGKVLVGAMFFSSGVRALAFSMAGGLAKLAVRGIAGTLAMGGAGVAGAAGGGVSLAGGLMAGMNSGVTGYGLGRGQDFRKHMARRGTAGGIAGAAIGAAGLGIKALSGEEITGRDYGGAAGMAVGGAVGAAFAGPIGAMIGGTIGNVAGEFLGKAFEKTTKSIASFDFSAGGMAQTAKVLDGLNKSANANRLAFQLDTAAIQGRATAFSDMSATLAGMTQQQLLEIDARVQASDMVADAFMKLAKSGTALNDLQRDALTPVMSELARKGKITHEQFADFEKSGVIPLTKKELQKLGPEIMADTAFLADTRRRAAQELELKLAGIKAEETKSALAIEGKKLEIQKKRLTMGDIEGRQEAWSSYTRGAGQAATNPRVVAAQTRLGEALSKHSDLRSDVNLKRFDPATRKQVLSASANKVEKAREGVAEAYRASMKDAGVLIPQEVETLLKNGVNPASQSFQNVLMTLSKQFDTVVSDFQDTERQLNQLELERAMVSYNSQVEQAKVTKKFTDEVSKSAFKLETDRLLSQVDAWTAMPIIGEVNRILNSGSFEQGAATSLVGRLRNLVPHAAGGRISTPTLLSDMSGRPYGTMAERGPEEIVPTTGSGSMADLIRAVREEGARTREALRRGARVEITNKTDAALTAATR